MGVGVLGLLLVAWFGLNGIFLGVCLVRAWHRPMPRILRDTVVPRRPRRRILHL